MQMEKEKPVKQVVTVWLPVKNNQKKTERKPEQRRSTGND